MRTRILPIVFVLSVLPSVKAQNVGINSTGASPHASAMLGVVSTTGGILIPRMTAAQRTAIASPATGLLVYQTNASSPIPADQFWFYDGTAWRPLFSDRIGWSIWGNTGTTPGTNFLGTTDNVGLRIKTNNADRFEFTNNGRIRSYDNGTAAQPTYSWNGASAQNTGMFYPAASTLGFSSAGVERIRVNATGQASVNRTSAATGDVFSVYANGTGGTASPGDFAINGYTDTGYGIRGVAANTAGIGVVAVNSATTGNSFALWSEAASRNGRGIMGLANGSAAAVPNNSNAIGVQGQVNGTLAATGQAIGVLGITNTTMTTGNAIGVGGQSASSAGTGVIGITTNNTDAGTTDGVYGESRAGLGNGVYGYATYSGSGSVQPQGVYGRANHATGFGVVADNNNTSGTGLAGAGQNEVGRYLMSGSGIAATGFSTGIYSYFSTPGVGEGLLIQDVIGAQWNVGYWSGTQYRKIVGNGTVNTVVKDIRDERVLLSCPEAPEALFQDYGTGQLVNGHAHVALDPTLSKNIFVDEEHPMKVFIQPEGDCKGVYVTNKSSTGFDVHELAGGTSNIPFSWTIVATRGDETYYGKNGEVRHVTYRMRFPPAPPIQETKQLQVKEAKTQRATSVQDMKVLVADPKATKTVKPPGEKP